jgi:hypothetical protein
MVAVRLPDDLGVSADTMVTVVDERREPERRLASALVVTIPVDGIAEVAVDEVEEAEPVGGDLLGAGDQTVTPPALIVTLWDRPFADADVAYPESWIATRTSSRDVTASRPRLQSQRQAAPQLGVAQPIDRPPRELPS